MWQWIRRYGELVGVVTGPLISLVSLGLLLIGVSQFGLPVLAWLGIGDAIFLVSGAAMIFDAHGAQHTVQARLDAQEARSKRLRESREVTGETFYVWELFKPNAISVVTGRTFTDCKFHGRAVITFLGPDNKLNDFKLGEGGLDEVLIELSPSRKQGIYGFLNCTFNHVEFLNVAFLGDQAQIDWLRKVTTVV